MENTSGNVHWLEPAFLLGKFKLPSSDRKESNISDIYDNQMYN